MIQPLGVEMSHPYTVTGDAIASLPSHPTLAPSPYSCHIQLVCLVQEHRN